MDELVSRLCTGEHPVSFEERVKQLKQVEDRIRDGFVFVKFTQTRGGTELGIDLVPSECDFSNADFASGKGKVHVVGTCELNYCKVKCIADVDLSSREGNGYLQLLDQEK